MANCETHPFSRLVYSEMYTRDPKELSPPTRLGVLVRIDKLRINTGIPFPLILC